MLLVKLGCSNFARAFLDFTLICIVPPCRGRCSRRCSPWEFALIVYQSTVPHNSLLSYCTNSNKPLQTVQCEAGLFSCLNEDGSGDAYKQYKHYIREPRKNDMHTVSD